jgi:hypothetical protein
VCVCVCVFASLPSRRAARSESLVRILPGNMWKSLDSSKGNGLEIDWAGEARGGANCFGSFSAYLEIPFSDSEIKFSKSEIMQRSVWGERRQLRDLFLL